MKKNEEFGENSEFLLIPKERVGALIGKGGSTKRNIERKTKVKLVVDSKEGEIEIIQGGDSLDYFKATRIVKAIGRGFAPEKALKLLSGDVFLELIDLEDVVGKSRSTMTVKKGRVIGAKGKAREEIERETGASISVFGKTISIIGKEKEIADAKKAVQMLLGGASHSAAYSQLKRRFENDYFEL